MNLIGLEINNCIPAVMAIRLVILNRPPALRAKTLLWSMEESDQIVMEESWRNLD